MTTREKGANRRRLIEVLLDPRLKVTLEPLTRRKLPPLARSEWRAWTGDVRVEFAPQAVGEAGVQQAHASLEGTALDIWQDLLGALEASVRHEQDVEQHTPGAPPGAWFPKLQGETFDD